MTKRTATAAAEGKLWPPVIRPATPYDPNLPDPHLGRHLREIAEQQIMGRINRAAFTIAETRLAAGQEASGVEAAIKALRAHIEAASADTQARADLGEPWVTAMAVAATHDEDLERLMHKLALWGQAITAERG